MRRAFKCQGPRPDETPMDFQGKEGPGLFQWNRGGWFGSQLGMTLWIGLLGVFLVSASPAVGLALIGLTLLANGLGTLLWMRRDRLAPYPAIQALLVIGGLCAVLALVVVADAGLPAQETGLPTPWFLLMYPGLMLSFHLRERAARRALAD